MAGEPDNTKIVLDAKSGHLLVWALPEEHLGIQQVLKQIDLPPSQAGAPVLKLYDVPPMPVKDLLDSLKIVAPQAKMNLQADGQRLSVVATPTDQDRIATTLHELAAAAAAAEKTRCRIAVADRILDRLAENLGFLDYCASVEATEEYKTTTESIAVLMPDAASRPIYSVFGNRSPLTDFDRYLPRETLSFSISQGIDLVALYEFIEDTVRLAGPTGEEVLAKWEEIQKQIGVDIRKDVIGWIDGDSISMTLADGGTVTLIKVTDEEAARDKISAAIEFSATKLAELIKGNPSMAGLNMLRMRSTPLRDERLEGFQNLRFAFSPKPVVWGVTEGYLVFGSSADAIALCLATAGGGHPGIRSNERAMSEAIVPDGPFTAVSFKDLRDVGKNLEEGLGVASMVMGMLGTFVPDPKAQPVVTGISGILGKLAPVVSEIDFYKSSASCTTFDGKMWRTRGVTHYFSPGERE